MFNDLKKWSICNWWIDQIIMLYKTSTIDQIIMLYKTSTIDQIIMLYKISTKHLDMQIFWSLVYEQNI